jgi:predicted nucleic acid-binding protein
MYLVGVEHPNKRQVIELVAQLIVAREELVTSAETFQEILHRYQAIRRHEGLGAAYEALEAIVSTVADVTKDDVDQARMLSGQYPELSARDCVHVAVMRRMQCLTIWSYDSGFSAVGAIQRIE